jgi:hypothetical protein
VGRSVWNGSEPAVDQGTSGELPVETVEKGELASVIRQTTDTMGRDERLCRGVDGRGKNNCRAGYRRVLEDGPETCSSESAAEYGKHGEAYSDSDMYTPGMLDESGKQIMGKAMMTTGQANRLRKQGRAGGSDRVSGDRCHEV